VRKLYSLSLLYSGNYILAVDSQVVFWSSEATVGEPAAFQLSLTAPTHISISGLPITSLAVVFAENIPTIIVRHSASDSDNLAAVRRIDLGHVVASKAAAGPEEMREVQAHLRWQRGATFVFTGTIASEIPRALKVRIASCRTVYGSNSGWT
jgi:hypothetical protein